MSSAKWRPFCLETPRGWIQIGESRTRGVARIPLGLKPSRDSRATSRWDSPIWIQPLGVFRYRMKMQLEQRQQEMLQLQWSTILLLTKVGFIL